VWDKAPGRIQEDLRARRFEVRSGDDFTFNSLTDALCGALDVAHVFTHFSLGGDIESSELTLGERASDGRHKKATLKNLAEKFRSNAITTRSVDFAACESALAPEGLKFECMGAFMMYYGASSVLGTLYEVNADATSLFMRRFDYRAQTHDRASALQAAAKAFIDRLDSKPNQDHPYYWAGYVLLGG
jgi:CHAT domain-containing protein